MIDSLFNVLNPIHDSINGELNLVGSEIDLADNLPALIFHTEQFLPVMDEIVNRMQYESERKVAFLITIEMILALVSLLILGLEFQFIFRPIITELSRKNYRLQKLNLSKDRIMATIVHDLRNPFNGIVGLNDLLKEDLKDKITDDQEMMFDLIKESSDKGLSLIQELLDIAVIESESYHLETEQTHIKEYLVSILSQFKSKAEEKGIQLEVDIQDDVLIASIDQDKFARVIENLITNALKFTESPGKVIVSSFKKENKVIIKVEDTGIGIPEEMQKFIFDKFSKARRLGLQGETSSGLGMSIVKEIVELHKGNISFESKEKKGTNFLISLPAK